MLFRAVAYRLVSVIGGADEPEVHVFFEAPDDADAKVAGAHLSVLLSTAWWCDPEDVDFYNVFSESDLRSQTYAPAQLVGDMHLLECGWDGKRPIYVRPDRTLMLVRPSTLKRLHDAAARAVVGIGARRAA